MYGIINKTNVQNVKNTMIDTVLSYLAPHLCYGCGKVGTILCDNCKNNIVDDYFECCILCGSLTQAGNCTDCLSPIARGWCVGEREGVLRKILDAHKFERVKAAHKVLAALAAEVTPALPSDCIVVPIPTTFAHIRQRGYDHSQLLAKSFTDLKGCRYAPLLNRQKQSTQRGHSRKERIKQAEEAFALEGTVEKRTYILVDDVVTTGATLRSAAHLLRARGAEDVWAVALMRQPLD
jgi:ComF family protein